MLALNLLLICASTLAVRPPTPKPYYSIANAEKHFEEFINVYGRSYADEAEKRLKLEIFKQNLMEINKRNMEDEGAIYGINQFADLTEEEMAQFKGLSPASDKCELLTGVRSQNDIHKCKVQTMSNTIDTRDLPDKLDWREKNVVSPVKNQGTCGSCWTFGTTGNIESMYAIKYGKLVELAEQQLLDCDKINKGCKGGVYNTSFGGLVSAGGMMAQKDYPYKGREGDCKFDKSKVVAKLKDCIVYELQSEEQLRSYVVNNGPVAISISAWDIQAYSDGIITKCQNRRIDHAVLVVGYGTENGIPYWIVKNSWGKEYGEAGYFRLKRDINACGLVNPCAATAVIE